MFCANSTTGKLGGADCTNETTGKIMSIHIKFCFYFWGGHQSVRDRTAQASTPPPFKIHWHLYEESVDWIVGLDYFHFGGGGAVC